MACSTSSPGAASAIGDALVGHPDVRRVAFTGSTAVGRHVAATAGPGLKRVTLELGGSDPVIVCADADVDAAVKAVIIGRYWNAGQACLGCKRVFVARLRLRRLRLPARRARRPLRAGRRHRQGREAAPADGPDPHARGARRAARADRGRRGQGRRGADRRRHRRPRQGLVPRARGGRRAGRGLAAGAPRRCSAPCCRSSATPTSTRRSGAPTTRRYGLGSSIWTHDVRKSTARRRRSTPA